MFFLTLKYIWVNFITTFLLKNFNVIVRWTYIIWYFNITIKISIINILLSFYADELFFVVWLTDEKHIVLFPAGIIVRNPNHRKSKTHRELDLNLRQTWVQVLLNEVVM